MSEDSGNSVQSAAPPEIPRDELCTKHPWCLLRTGHEGGCTISANAVVGYTRQPWDRATFAHDPSQWRDGKRCRGSQ